MVRNVYLVTPSFNSAATILQTIYSVCQQAGRFRLHYHVQDGGSTDGTVELLLDWKKRVSRAEIDIFCEELIFTFDSTPDKGMYDAICRAIDGCGASSEEWVGWINSDDRLTAGALALLMAIDDQLPGDGVDWVGGAAASAWDNLIVGWGDRPLSSDLIAEGLCDGKHWHFVQQEGIFFRRRLWDEANPAKTLAPFRYAGDWNLWRTFAKRHRFHQVRWPLGVFTRTEGQLSQKYRQEYMAEINRMVPERVRTSRLLTFRSRDAFRDSLTTEYSQRVIRKESKPIRLEPWLSDAWKEETAAIQSISVAPYHEDRAVTVRPGLVAYDADWQFPAITEKHAFAQVRDFIAPIDGVCYLAFPWATLIDHLQTGGARALGLKARLWSLKEALSKYKRVVTVCQHIYMAKYVDLLLEAGVTDAFWSHATVGLETLGKARTLRVHPFPLFPVQLPDSPIPEDSGPRRYLFSFIGAKANPDHYLTNSRDLITEELAGTPGALVRVRDSWHYERIVYDHQILGRRDDTKDLVNDNWSEEFRSLLTASTFTLCPSGSGPNSIRLWEAIGAGSIPVVLADSYLPPGDPDLWQEATVRCAESREAIRQLPKRLAEISSNHSVLASKRRALRRLFMKYGPGCFVFDIQRLYQQIRGSSFSSRAVSKGQDWLLDRATDVLRKRSNEDDSRLFVVCCSNRIIADTAAFAQSCREHAVLRDALRMQLARSGLEHVVVCREALIRHGPAFTELNDLLLST